MSIDERIQHLEAEKRACMQHFDEAISSLWNLKKGFEDDLEPSVEDKTEAPLLYGRFRPVRIKGKPLSQTIMEDRGNY